MLQNTVCPFYGKNDDYCDVGCGYISPYDVKQIIKFCSCRYRECLKYRELSDRMPVEMVETKLCGMGC
jgi:hypothetical protein